MSTTTDLVARAEAFARQAHQAINHRRKYTGECYTVHLAAVAGIVATVPHTPVMLAASFLHDTREDTPTTAEDILREFGPVVAELVEWLTDLSVPADGNRAARKAKDRAHLAAAPAEAQTIKLADLIDNTRSIVQHDLNFAQVYLPEKRDLLEVLVRGDQTLMARAQDELRRGFEAMREGA